MMLPLLGGCAAALAVPVLTAVGMVTERKRTRAQVVADLPAANTAAMAALPDPAGENASVQLTGLTALPPPTGGSLATVAPWREFASYALARAGGLAQDRAATSALLTPDGVLSFRHSGETDAAQLADPERSAHDLGYSLGVAIRDEAGDAIEF